MWAYVRSKDCVCVCSYAGIDYKSSCHVEDNAGDIIMKCSSEAEALKGRQRWQMPSWVELLLLVVVLAYSTTVGEYHCIENKKNCPIFSYLGGIRKLNASHIHFLHPLPQQQLTSHLYFPMKNPLILVFSYVLQSSVY